MDGNGHGDAARDCSARESRAHNDEGDSMSSGGPKADDPSTGDPDANPHFKNNQGGGNKSLESQGTPDINPRDINRGAHHENTRFYFRGIEISRDGDAQNSVACSGTESNEDNSDIGGGAEEPDSCIGSHEQNPDVDVGISLEKVQAAYRILRLVNRQSLEEAIKEMKKLVELSDCQIASMKVAIDQNGSSRVENRYTSSHARQLEATAYSKLMQPKSNRGRRVGSRNKKGHREGGDRKSARVQEDTQLHVGPLPTLGQSREVAAVGRASPRCNPSREMAAVSRASPRCKWWPLCKYSAVKCGGRNKQGCKYYGTHGAKEPPTEEEFNRIKRKETWQPHALSMDCAYHPYCPNKAWYCGGIKKANCTVFHGPNALQSPPSDEQLNKAKQKRKRKRQRQRDRDNMKHRVSNP